MKKKIEEKKTRKQEITDLFAKAKILDQIDMLREMAEISVAEQSKGDKSHKLYSFYFIGLCENKTGVSSFMISPKATKRDLSWLKSIIDENYRYLDNPLFSHFEN